MSPNNTFMRFHNTLLFVTSILAIIPLVIGSILTAHWRRNNLPNPTYAIIALSIGANAVVSLPIMLFTTIKHIHCSETRVLTQLIRSFCLLVVWFVAAGFSVAYYNDNCSPSARANSKNIRQACTETQVVSAFSFIEGILLLVFLLLLLVACFKRHMNGHKRVWFEHVCEADYTATGPPPAGRDAEHNCISPKKSTL